MLVPFLLVIILLIWNPFKFRGFQKWYYYVTLGSLVLTDLQSFGLGLIFFSIGLIITTIASVINGDFE